MVIVYKDKVLVSFFGTRKWLWYEDVCQEIS